ncbi:hypothetical protein [Enterococcus hirae]|uniref:hypothetical protein n=1 Tax=Enterococcus hirae TaxID=1354 RepID=UPI003981DF4C
MAKTWSWGEVASNKRAKGTGSGGTGGGGTGGGFFVRGDLILKWEGYYDLHFK